MNQMLFLFQWIFLLLRLEPQDFLLYLLISLLANPIQKFIKLENEFGAFFLSSWSLCSSFNFRLIMLVTLFNVVALWCVKFQVCSADPFRASGLGAISGAKRRFRKFLNYFCLADFKLGLILKGVRVKEIRNILRILPITTRYLLSSISKKSFSTN